MIVREARKEIRKKGKKKEEGKKKKEGKKWGKEGKEKIIEEGMKEEREDRI